jgi:hypothetical protein
MNMSKFSFEQYRKVFDDLVEQHQDEPFYRALIDKFGVPTWPQNPLECALLGIRHDGKDVDHREDIADDTIVLCGVKADGQPVIFEAAGTTESGLFTETINPNGDFKMYPGFYFFKRGLHKGTKPCLVQAGLVRGERAKKKSGYDGKEWTDTAGTIHIHAGIMNPKRVGNWSAGCQVIAHGWTGKPWLDIFGACKRSPQSSFPYVLVDEADVIRILET